MEDASDWREQPGARDERDRCGPSVQPARGFVCPLCKSEAYEALSAYRGADLLLYKCAGCTLTFTDPQRFVRPRA